MQNVKLLQKDQLICVQELNAQKCDTQNGMKARHESWAWRQGTKVRHGGKARMRGINDDINDDTQNDMKDDTQNGVT